MSQNVIPIPSVQPRNTIGEWIKRHQLITFFVLTYLIQFGAVYASLWFDIPFMGIPWFLSVFNPTIAALIICAVIGGRPEVKKLLRGYTLWKVGGQWYLGAAFLLFIALGTALVYRLLGGAAPGLAPGATPAFLVGQFFFILISGPFAEEGGWRGFALPRLQQRYNALVSGLILGVIWSCWHIPLYFHPLTSNRLPFPAYLAINTVLTIYMTWLYNNTKGSLVIAILAHFCFNLVGGFVTGLLGLIPMNAFLMYSVPAQMVVFLWVIFRFGPRYLSRKPVSELPFTPKA